MIKILQHFFLQIFEDMFLNCALARSKQKAISSGKCPHCNYSSLNIPFPNSARVQVVKGPLDGFSDYCLLAVTITASIVYWALEYFMRKAISSDG